MQRKRKGFRRKPEPRFKFRINKMIRVPEVRLVGENVEPGVFDIRDAQRMANDLDLDLVEISPKADPPVCKIIDYRKFLYDKKKKEKEMKSKQVKTVIKEIRFTPNTDEHDFEFKAKHAERFLQEGSKVKTYVHFKGRHIVFKDRGEMLLLRFAQRLEEWGIPEQMPKMEGRRMNMFLAPKKVQKVKPKGAKTEGESKKSKAPKTDKADAAATTAEPAEVSADTAPITDATAAVTDATAPVTDTAVATDTTPVTDTAQADAAPAKDAESKMETAADSKTAQTADTTSTKEASKTSDADTKSGEA